MNLFDKNDPKDFSDKEEIICVLVFLFFLFVGIVGAPICYILACIVLIRQIARFMERKMANAKIEGIIE